jgi:transcriptional regulator with XRE-family HTH domain
MPPSDEVRERFGINLRQGRKQLGVTQYEIAFRAEVALPAVGLFELGKKIPRIDTFIRLAGAVERNPSELIAGILWIPGEVVATPGNFDVPEDPDLAAEVAKLRAGARKFRGKGAKG